MIEDDEPDVVTCPRCHGSGEGMADRTTCGRCKGRGEIPAARDEDDDDGPFDTLSEKELAR